MRRLFLKNINKKKIFTKFEYKKKMYKILAYDLSIPYCFRFFFLYKLSNFKRNSSIVRIRSYCFSTGRSRAIFIKYSMYRSVFRNVVSSGFLYGFKKASW